jgi:hypothetical protein
MPHSGYTICTSEQRPASTTVSHGFTVGRYSSPPFGSHGPCKHSKPCPLDVGSGDPMQVPPSGMRRCLHRALAVCDSCGESLLHQATCASSIDSLVRVSRRAVSGTDRFFWGFGQAQLPCAPGPQRGIGGPGTAATSRVVQPPDADARTPGSLSTGVGAGVPGSVRRHRQGFSGVGPLTNCTFFSIARGGHTLTGTGWVSSSSFDVPLGLNRERARRSLCRAPWCWPPGCPRSPVPPRRGSHSRTERSPQTSPRPGKAPRKTTHSTPRCFAAPCCSLSLLFGVSPLSGVPILGVSVARTQVF